MHHCPDCTEVCECPDGHPLTMQPAPDDCAHGCQEQRAWYREAAAGPRQPPKPRWPWDQEAMQGEREGWPS